MSVTAVPIPPTKRSVLAWIWVGVAVALAGALALAYFGTRGAVATSGTEEQFLAYNARQAGVTTTPSGVQVLQLEAGEGSEKPTTEDVVLINYSGALRDGTVFDASQQPTPMPVSGVVPGFSEGLQAMSKGGKYRIWIPAEQGYGDASPDPTRIPNGSTLIFDVELVDFIPAAVLQQQMQMQQMQQMMQGGAQGAPGAPGGPPGAPQGE